MSDVSLQTFVVILSACLRYFFTVVNGNDCGDVLFFLSLVFSSCFCQRIAFLFYFLPAHKSCVILSDVSYI